MTPEECREISSKNFDAIKKGLELGDVAGSQISAITHLFQGVWEIAAQLAELNQKIKVLDSTGNSG
jgi:hypothetical protein